MSKQGRPKNLPASTPGSGSASSSPPPPGADNASSPGAASGATSGGTSGGWAGKLTSRQEQAIIALLREPTLAQVAKAAGIAERTLHRWMGLPAFRSAYRTARREVFNQALALVHKYSPMAVNTLARTLTDPMAPAHTKVAAAVAILKLGRDAIEIDDLQERVSALEMTTSFDTPPRKRVYKPGHEAETFQEGRKDRL